MPNFLAKQFPHNLAYFFKLEASIQVFFYFFSKLLLVGLFQIVIVDLLQQTQSYLVNTVENPHCHTLDKFKITLKVAFTSCTILLM